jgi:hypothetical protein
MPRTRKSAPPDWADTAAAVTSRRHMDVTLPSGLKFTLQTVTLDELAVDDAIPGDLLAAAILDSADLLLPQMLQDVRAGKPEEAQKLSRDMLALRDRVCARAIVKPDPTAGLLAALDGFDKQMIVELAQRKRSIDAAGKVVAAQVLGDLAGFRDEPVGAAVGAAGGANGELPGVVG